MTFYLVLRHHAAPIDEQAAVIEHLVWMRDQHKRGTVLISGPSSDGAAGIYMLRMASREEASALASSDPPTKTIWSELRSSSGMSTKYWESVRSSR